ncbi:MAG: LutB/LldF family L-lactate oxidation iron-sulfur protein [Candidatus Kryptoniota bacterium]
MSTESPEFKSLYKKQLSNHQLRENLSKATLQSVEKRNKSFEGISFEYLRNQARQIKLEALSRLNEYLAQFEDNAIRNGCSVFYASTASNAREYILEVARSIGSRLIVKSKSMVTEEIELVPFLEKNHINTVETDLGEYIVQLAGERPSHITTPAIHKSRYEISELFQSKLGAEKKTDPQFLTSIARQILREKFLNADMGISGANFLIAETGDVVIVENEGNARLSTSSPKVHLVVTGIEKILPRFSDLRIFLRLLGRSSTGQKLTSYTSILRSPRTSEELDGPDALHIVILDNGRTNLLGTEYQEILNCIRCGACLNVCPVYRKVGGHAYGSVYPGPIGSLVTPLYSSMEKGRDLAFASTLCGNCTEVCPVGIDIHHHLLKLRSDLNKKHKHFAEKFLINQFTKVSLRPGLFSFLGDAARFLSSLHLLKFFLKSWSKERSVPDLPGKSFKKDIAKVKP